MSVAQITVNVPAKPVAVPRGALLFGLIADFVLELSAARKARNARRQLERDTLELRSLAQSLRSTAPSLAADLLAAADRSL